MGFGKKLNQELLPCFFILLSFKKKKKENKKKEIYNDPSAGSPTETLLRLLLPLDDQV